MFFFLALGAGAKLWGKGKTAVLNHVASVGNQFCSSLMFVSAFK